MRSLKEGFDVLSYLDDMGIEYSTGGDNVSSGWVGIQCPFCSDHKNHLGINLNHKNFSCWICNERGDVVKLIQELEGISFIKAKQRVEEYQNAARGLPERPRNRFFSQILPKG